MKVTTGPTEPVESVRGVRRLVPTTHVSRRRSVVVFAVLLVLTGLVGGLPELAGAPGVVVPVLTLLGILACLGVGALIRASIDATGDLPDDQLDERLVAERDGAYLAAYRLVATIFVLVAVTADALHARVDVAPLLGAMLPVVPPLVLFTPSAVIAWRRGDLS